jgi:hypothetical protein
VQGLPTVIKKLKKTIVGDSQRPTALVSASSRDWGGLLSFFILFFLHSAIPWEGSPAGSQLGLMEDPVSLLKSSDFGVGFNCSCIVFFSFLFFFWHM